MILLGGSTLFVIRQAVRLSGYEWPSPQYDALETFLYEGRDLATSDIFSIVWNCKVRGSPDSTVAAKNEPRNMAESTGKFPPTPTDHNVTNKLRTT
jgi:hypothetical protein